MTPGGAYPFDLAGSARLLVDEADAETALAILTGPRNHVNAKEER